MNKAAYFFEDNFRFLLKFRLFYADKKRYDYN